jgi:hypothetical protein
LRQKIFFLRLRKPHPQSHILSLQAAAVVVLAAVVVVARAVCLRVQTPVLPIRLLLRLALAEHQTQMETIRLLAALQLQRLVDKVVNPA